MKNILVAIEFDNDAEPLVGKALELAKPFKAKVWLLHIAAPDPDFVGYDAGPQSVRDNLAKELRIKHIRLQDRAKDLENKGFDAEALLVQGPTVKTLIEESKKLNADLLIAGYEEHSFVYKLLIGSVSFKILKKSKVPILMVPLK